MAKKKTEQETLAERLRRMAQTDIRAVDKKVNLRGRAGVFQFL